MANYPLLFLGFTSGSLYFPVVLNEHPTFLIPQSLLPTTLDQTATARRHRLRLVGRGRAR